MSKAETGGAAFPTIDCDEASLSNGGSYTRDKGMTLRDYFAAIAMHALWSSNDQIEIETPRRVIAEHAYAMADDMLEARKH